MGSCIYFHTRGILHAESIVRMYIHSINDPHIRIPLTHHTQTQVITLKKVPSGKRNDKPLRLPLPHPIYSTEDTDVCLFVKDRKGTCHP